MNMINFMRNPGCRILLFGLTVLLTLVFLNSTRNTVPIRTTIETIRVVMDDNYPPYTFLDTNGNPQGILIDQWRLWEQKTGIKVVLSSMDWNEAQNEMEAGNFDVIDTIFFNGERAKIYDFSAPYADIDVPIYFDNHISGLTDVRSLEGFSVGVKDKDNAVQFLHTHGIEKLELFDSYETIILAARDKQIHVFVVDKPAADYFIYKYSLQSEINSSDPLYTGQFHRAVRKGNKELLSIVEEGFTRISPTEYSTINARWFGNRLAASPYTRFVLAGIGLSGLVFFILVISNRELQRRVSTRTTELNTLFSAMQDIVIVLDKNGKCLSIPPTASPAIADHRNDILGKNLDKWLPGSTAQYITDTLRHVLFTQKSETIESPLEMNGSSIWFSGVISPLDRDRVLFVAHDLTQWKNTQEALRESEQRFRVMFENHDVSMLLISPENGEIINANQAAVEFYGYPIESIRNMTINQINQLPIEDVQKAMQLILAENQTKFVFPHRLAGGETRIVEIHSSPVRVENKDLLFSIIFDITDRRNAEEAVENKTRELSDAYELTLMGWSNALEMRERETAGHSKRVVDMTLRICREMGIPEEELIHIQRGALLHDIGKMGIPDNILLKPGPLSPDEWVIMRQHPLYAYRLLSKIPFLLPSLDIPYYHHERWDGSGYPFGLKGEEIPLAARIFAVVDVWDALISDRPYRPAWPEDAALRYIKDNAFVQFDPEIVRVFMRIHNDPSI